MITPVPSCRPSSATGPRAVPAGKTPCDVPVIVPPSVAAVVGVGTKANAAIPRTIRVTQNIFFMLPPFSVNLNVAATQGAGCDVTIAHVDAKGVGIFPGLTVVANVDLESERSVSIDGRCAKDLCAVSGNHN